MVKRKLVSIFLQAKFSNNETFVGSIRTVEPELFYHENREDKIKQRLKVGCEKEFEAIQNFLTGLTVVSYTQQFTSIEALS
jgi:hypothetical protein